MNSILKFAGAILAAQIIFGCNAVEHKKIVPLEPGIDVGHLENCTVAASFTADDFNWRGDLLSLRVFNEILYDAVDVNLLEKGDTLVYDGESIVVETITNEGWIEVNGGIENGGVLLSPNDGGCYRAVLFDDHSVYEELGKAELTLSQDFRISGCGDNPSDPGVVVTEGQKAYIDMLPDHRKTFTCLDTRVVIESGELTEIIRRWIP